MRWLLARITLRLKIRPIYHEGGLYLKRYYVCTLFNYWRVYLHHFMLDDPDGLHNHPWKYGFSIILAGHYYEKRRWGHRHIRWINVVNGDTLHKVCLPYKYQALAITEEQQKNLITQQPVWSLFVHSPRRCDWGFLRSYKEQAKRQEAQGVPYVESWTIDGVYNTVLGTDSPTPLSDWHKDALTGAEWEAKQQQQLQQR